MISAAERAYLTARAYVPEHLPTYVTAISKAEPFLLDEYLVYVRESRLTFVGYPLEGEFDLARLDEGLQAAMGRFEPAQVSVIAPQAPESLEDCPADEQDSYYRLDLSKMSITKKLRNTLKRARQELSVEVSEKFGRHHKGLIWAFLRSRRLSKATQVIFKHIPAYLKTGTARLYEARDARGRLAAFDIADFGAAEDSAASSGAGGDYAFYMFNFCSRRHYVPGASDLLLWEIIEDACRQGKSYLNLGLGINPGVAYFKAKWGGRPFLPHVSCAYEAPGAPEVGGLLDKL